MDRKSAEGGSGPCPPILITLGVPVPSGLPLGTGTEGFVKGLEEKTGRVLRLRRGGWPKGRPRKKRAGKA